jgi:hypothetical protein
MPPKPKPVAHSSGTSTPSGGGHGKGKHAPLPFVYPSSSGYGVHPTGGAVVVRAAPARGAVRVITPLTVQERRLFGPMFDYEPSWGDVTRPWRRARFGVRRSDDGRRHLIATDGLGQTDAASTTPIAGLVAVGFIAAGIFWFASSKKTTVANRRRRMRRNRYWYYA